MHRTIIFHDDGHPGRVAPFGVTVAIAARLEADVVIARAAPHALPDTTWARAIDAAQTASIPVTVKIKAEEQPLEDWLADLGGYADLLVAAGAGGPDFARTGKMIEHLAGRIGCPFLVLPEHVVLEHVARRIAIAWHPGAPAQRAVLAALPLLAHAEAVTVIGIDPDQPLNAVSRLKQFLDQRGIAATICPIIGSEAEAGALIADAADQARADLLVMGAWSGSHLDRLLIGGTTDQLIGKLALPLLISH